MRVTLLNGLVGSAAALGLLAPAAAQAQHKHCQTRGYPHLACCDGKHTLPVFDKHYIKKFCGPTINPGTCFGYYPTRWTRWEDACPPGADCADGPAGYGPGAAYAPNAPGIVPTNPPPGVEPAPGPGLIPGPAPAVQPVPPNLTNPALPGTPPERRAPAPRTSPDTTPERPMPLPVPGTPPPAKPDKPRNEASAVPAPSTLIEPRVPEVNIQYPVTAPAQPNTLPATNGKSS